MRRRFGGAFSPPSRTRRCASARRAPAWRTPQLSMRSLSPRGRLLPVVESGRPDLNRGPLVPQTSALTRLRHAPSGPQFTVGRVYRPMPRRLAWPSEATSQAMSDPALLLLQPLVEAIHEVGHRL